jgi:AbrB family looped-hinge helix DNA binding protein
MDKVKVTKWGYTHRVVIPAEIIKEMGIKKGDCLFISKNDNKIIIEKENP